MLLGMIGLGAMGKPIARHLAKGPVTFISVTQNKDTFHAFQQEGISISSSLSDLETVDILFLCLPNGEINRNCLFGPDQLASKLKPGAIVVDLGSTSHAETLATAEALKKFSIAYMDAPISGLSMRAKEGTLTIMCGGDEDTFDAIKPYLEMFGREILFMGPCGSGQLAKLINNMIYNINIAALAELLPLSVKLGLDPENIGKIVTTGSSSSFASQFFLPSILEGNFNNSYSLENAYKDLINLTDLTHHKNIPLPMMSAAMSTYQMALLKGYGQLDKSGMIKIYEDLFEVKFRKKGRKLPDSADFNP